MDDFLVVLREVRDGAEGTKSFFFDGSLSERRPRPVSTFS